MKYIFGTIIILVFSVMFVGAVNKNDWLNDAFKGSHESTGDPYSSDVEADDLFNSDISIGTSGIGMTDTVFVRLARLMLRLTVILAIPMVIYSGIRIMLAAGDSDKMRSAVKHIGRVALGVLLALLSVMIVYLLIALARTSVGTI